MKYTKIVLPCRIKSGVLAVGAQSKSAFCFSKGNSAYLSDSGGDLSDLENFKKFEREIKKLQKKLNIKPEIIACDLHPEYISTKHANELAKAKWLRIKAVQHHEAHVASCIVDNSIKGKVIGVAFDGTGFGADSNIWGGEFFTGSIKGLKRAVHLEYIPMPGGEACIREPWRMAFSYLYDIYGKGKASKILKRLDNKKMGMLEQAMDKKINSPLTSSVGRLFDGVSSLIGLCDYTGYEGEAAIRLEKIIRGEGLRVKGEYKFKYAEEGGMIIIEWEPVIKGIVKDLKKGISESEVSLKFHNAICNMIKETCILLRKKHKINKVCLSGGVFQNKYLKTNASRILTKQGFKCYFHNKTPTHDGGIALGQAVLAGA
ncbi:MAG: hypothetical protein NTX47_00375 [Candidatus Omnitrophica bacterium]|nr:hypothetical protein [Candidatus Omnitrophota bacterium]